MLSLRFVDHDLMHTSRSYEQDAARYALAIETQSKLVETIHVQIERGSFFSYKRPDAMPHIFFLDIEGIFARSDFPRRFSEMFQEETIREGDFLIITSHLGHIGGDWPAVFKSYNGEYSLLGATDEATKRTLYRRAHPSFTLFRALESGNLETEISIKCIGCIEYRDKSPMGLYGYVFASGATNFREFINDVDYLHFHVKKGFLAPPRSAAEPAG